MHTLPLLKSFHRWRSLFLITGIQRSPLLIHRAPKNLIVFIFAHKPNVIEPCAPGVAADHEHPGLPHQLDQSAPMLGSNLVIIIMVKVVRITIMMRMRRMVS